MNDSFAESRASLRAFLGVPGDTAGNGARWMPRSNIMRAVMNPRNRPVFLAAVTIATLVFPRLTRAGMFYPLVSKVAIAGRHLLKMRLSR
jgi:hypothetical protein